MKKNTTTANQLTVEMWAIARVKPYPKNARRLSDKAVAKVAASLKEFGWRQPCVVDKKGVLVAGHTRLLAAQSLGMTEVPVHVAANLTPVQCRAYRLADNRVAAESSFDLELLGPELLELQALDLDLSLTGFDADELKMFMADPTEGLTDPDDCPAPQAEAISVAGDLWLCGDHRVYCGDSTSTDATARLFGEGKPNLAFCDPPYGISIVKGAKVGGGGALKFGGTDGSANWVDSKPYAEIAGDGSTEAAREFYHCAMAQGVEHFIIWGGNYFTDFLPPSPCWLIWDKQNTGNFADVEMAWASFDKGAKLYRWLWNGLSRRGDRKTELGSRVHPTQKPVGLFLEIFEDFPFKSCYDGFLGSGSTLIACEKADRICYGMELSPAYVDTAIQRWQNFTGKQATLEVDGRTFAELEAERKPKSAAA